MRGPSKGGGDSITFGGGAEASEGRGRTWRRSQHLPGHPLGPRRQGKSPLGDAVDSQAAVRYTAGAGRFYCGWSAAPQRSGEFPGRPSVDWMPRSGDRDTASQVLQRGARDPTRAARRAASGCHLMTLSPRLWAIPPADILTRSWIPLYLLADPSLGLLIGPETHPTGDTQEGLRLLCLV